MRAVLHLDMKTILLAGTALALLAANLAMSSTMIDISPSAVAAIPSGSANPERVGLPRNATADLQLPETLARPLFSPTRRDTVSAPAIEEPVETPQHDEVIEEVSLPTGLRLQGTRSLDGRLSALVAMEGEASAWLNEGDAIGGWRLVSVGAETISVSAGAETMTLSLHDSVERPSDAAVE